MDETSNKIMKTDEFEDSVFYRASCSCSNPECDLTLELFYNPGANMVAMTAYENLTYASWFGVGISERFYWFKDKWHRIKVATKLLLTGRIQAEKEFLFKDEQHIDAFITALNEGKEKVMKNKKD